MRQDRVEKGTIFARIIVYALVVGSLSHELYGISAKLPAEVTSLIKQYSREITILEVGNNECPWFSLLMQYNAQCIALCRSGASKTLLSSAVQGRVHPGIVLAPKKITTPMLLTLGSCEHFDIVIVHDLHQDMSDFKPFVSAFLRLGDHIVIEASSAEQCRICYRFWNE